MSDKPVVVKSYSFGKSWDAIWKWQWFTKDRWQRGFRRDEDVVVTQKVIQSLRRKYNMERILDCSCGLGRKTILLSEMGFNVEGSDCSALAVKYSRQLAKEEGIIIRVFRSKWEELGRKCERKFDCVLNDAFDLIQTRKSLRMSAKGIYSVLKKGGVFIFPGAHQWFKGSEKKKVIDIEWKSLKRFEIEPPYEKDGIRLTGVYIHEKKSEGILTNTVIITETINKMQIDIMRDAYIYFKWTWQDYCNTLKKAGFRKVYSLKVKGLPRRAPYIPNIAVK